MKVADETIFETIVSSALCYEILVKICGKKTFGRCQNFELMYLEIRGLGMRLEEMRVFIHEKDSDEHKRT